MMSTNNILSPSNGKPIGTQSDIVLGIYYLSQAEEKDKKPKGIFLSVEEIEQALENKSISLHSKIISILKQLIKMDQKTEKYTSTAGRFLLANLLPINNNIKFGLVNRLLTKNVSEVIDTIFRYCDKKKQ